MPRDLTADLIIDCDTCSVRGRACADCVVTVLLAELPMETRDEAQTDGVPGGLMALDPDEARALDVLAEGGLLPPLRLTPRSAAG
jgi:hypothetical protein